MQPNVVLETQILCAVDQHQGPRPFGHADLPGMIGDDRYVEAPRCVKRLYDDGLVSASEPPRQTLQSPSYGFILSGLTPAGRQRLRQLQGMNNPGV